MECPICYNNENTTFITLTCQHTLCWECLKKKVDLNLRQCCLCRADIAATYRNPHTQELLHYKPEVFEYDVEYRYEPDILPLFCREDTISIMRDVSINENISPLARILCKCASDCEEFNPEYMNTSYELFLRSKIQYNVFVSYFCDIMIDYFQSWEDNLVLTNLKIMLNLFREIFVSGIPTVMNQTFKMSSLVLSKFLLFLSFKPFFKERQFDKAYTSIEHSVETFRLDSLFDENDE